MASDQSSRHEALVEAVADLIEGDHQFRTACARAVLALIAERMKEVSEEQAEAWALASAGTLPPEISDDDANMTCAESDWGAMLSRSALTPGDRG